MRVLFPWRASYLREYEVETMTDFELSLVLLGMSVIAALVGWFLPIYILRRHGGDKKTARK